MPHHRVGEGILECTSRWECLGVMGVWLHLQNSVIRTLQNNVLTSTLRRNAEKNQLSLMQKIKFLCKNSNLTPLTSNTTNEESFHLPIKQYHHALTANQLTLQS